MQYVQCTHDHEDHLHEPSFHLLPKNATVLLTKQWFPGNRERLLDGEFERVEEMTSGRWMPLGDDLSMVSLVNRSDCLSVLRTSDEVLVNANNALNHSKQFLKLATKLPLQSDYLLMSPIRGVSHLIHGPYLARQPHGWSSGSQQRDHLIGGEEGHHGGPLLDRSAALRGLPHLRRLARRGPHSRGSGERRRRPVVA